MRIILASASAGRKLLLQDAGFVFEVIPSDLEEDMNQPVTPQELVKNLSVGKARSIATLHKDAIIVGADTVVVFEGKILGKPHTEVNSNRMLEMLSAKVHTVVTGLTVIDSRTQKEITISVETKVWFKQLSSEEIYAYTKTGEALQKAGAYAYQLNGHKFVDRIEGSESNIIGLPMEALKEILKQFSVI